jgi:hypothetical protein
MPTQAGIRRLDRLSGTSSISVVGSILAAAVKRSRADGTSLRADAPQAGRLAKICGITSASSAWLKILSVRIEGMNTPSPVPNLDTVIFSFGENLGGFALGVVVVPTRNKFRCRSSFHVIEKIPFVLFYHRAPPFLDEWEGKYGAPFSGGSEST